MDLLVPGGIRSGRRSNAAGSGVKPWEGVGGVLSVVRAVGAGLTSRPLAEAVGDVLGSEGENLDVEIEAGMVRERGLLRARRGSSL